MKIFKKVIFIIMFFMLIFMTKTYATNFELKPNITEKSLYAGEEFDVTLKLLNTNSSNKIFGIQGKMSFDEVAIESVSFEGLNNWSVTVNSEENSELKGTFVMVKLTEGGNLEEDVAKLHIKMKPTIEFNNTKISITNIETSNGSEEIKADNININIQILSKQDENSNQSENNNNNGNNNSNNNNSNNNGNGNSNNNNNNGNSNNSNNNNNKSQNNSQSTNSQSSNTNSNNGSNSNNKSANDKNISNNSNSKIPKLGIEQNLVLIIAVCGVISTIMFFKYKKYKSL